MRCFYMLRETRHRLLLPHVACISHEVTCEDDGKSPLCSSSCFPAAASPLSQDAVAAYRPIISTPAPAPTPTSSATNFGFLGCYADNQSGRVLSGEVHKEDSEMTTEVRTAGQSTSGQKQPRYKSTACLSSTTIRRQFTVGGEGGEN